MRDYELLYIVPGDKTESEAAKVIDAVNDWLKKHDGKAADQDAQGRKRLAYPIDKQDHGWYVVTRFAIEPAKLNEFSRGLDMNVDVLRSLIVSADELPTEEDLAKLEKPAEEKAEEAETKPAPTAKTPEVKKVEKPEPAEETEAEPEPKKPETAADKKKREAALEEKLGEILKDQDDE